MNADALLKATNVDGVAILALDDRNNVLTVTQYRYVFGRPLLEIPAGKLEPGEDPVSGALRELKEETGAVPDTFLPMGVVLPSPGCLGERLHLFLARGLHLFYHKFHTIFIFEKIHFAF